MGRSETIEGTAELVEAEGGRAIAVRVDHTDPAQVAALMERIRAESGRLDVLVNDIWGGDPLTRWGPFWEHPLEDGLRMQELGVWTHLVTSWHALPLMVAGGEGGLVIEMTDGESDGYRGSLFYDLVKASTIRLARAQAEELRPHGIAAVALTPGFMRSEAVLDHFGVTEERWRDAIERDPHFAASETPRFVGRAAAALAADPSVMEKTGQTLTSWDLAKEYGFDDVDGRRPDWGTHFRDHVAAAS
jgi:NAD(P)-dependent dehydrogenase (short-subunit alcohol dehydrogenase family)